MNMDIFIMEEDSREALEDAESTLDELSEERENVNYSLQKTREALEWLGDEAYQDALNSVMDARNNLDLESYRVRSYSAYRRLAAAETTLRTLTTAPLELEFEDGLETFIV